MLRTRDLSRRAQWREKTSSPNFARLYPNAVVLPTGQIFIEGGTSTDDYSKHCPTLGCTNNASNPVYAPIIYDPGSNGLNPGTIYSQNAPPPVTGFSVPTARLYHHVAALMPDGRVFIAGGKRPKDTNGLPTAGRPDPRFTGEVFSPPYLDSARVGPRPRFEAPLPPNQVSFSDLTTQSFPITIRHTLGEEIDAVVLLRPAAVTHHWDADQRYIELAFSLIPGSTQVEGNDVIESFTVNTPHKSLGPAGYYMLFVIEDDLLGAAPCTIEGHRVPSVAHFIDIQ